MNNKMETEMTQLKDLTNEIFGDNHSDLTEYYIESIRGEGWDDYSDTEAYDRIELEAFDWAHNFLVDFMMNTHTLPQWKGHATSSDETFLGWLVDGYEDYTDQMWPLITQMKRAQALDSILN